MNSIIPNLLRNKSVVIWASFAFLMITLSLIGGYRTYSPTPFMDMWDGALNFYIEIENGNHAEWWSQHNEHRIILSRFLFWLDYRFFDGTSKFLIVFNYIIVGLAAYIFRCYLRDASETKIATQSEKILFLFTTGLLFSWMQEGNLAWGFQSQFFLAQTMPLWALLWLTRSSKHPEGKLPFLIACLIGFLSACTMANGVLTLPILLICAITFKQGTTKVIELFTFSVIVIILYFYDYHSPDGHSNLLAAFGHPLDFVHYVALYLGNPISKLIGKGEFGNHVATLTGLVFLICSIWMFSRRLHHKDKSPEALALLFFILYICGTAFVTACGRLALGVAQAGTDRYTTPALMAWIALFYVFYLSTIDFTGIKVKKRIKASMIIFGILLLGNQFKAFIKPVDMSAKNLAALALSLEIGDQKYISFLYPSSDRAIYISKVASQRHYSIFGTYPYADLKQQLLKPYKGTIPTRLCIGKIDKIEPIMNVSNFVRVHGMLFDNTNQKSPILIRFVNKNGLVSGYALTGTPRSILANLNKVPLLSGFMGYMTINSTGQNIIAIGERPACSLTINVPKKF